MSLSIRESLMRGPATSRELQAETGLNQTAVSRKLRAMGDAIIKLQNGRSPKYALTGSAFGGNSKLPLAMVDADGETVLIATIYPLAHGGYFVEPEIGMPTVLLGEKGNGLYDDLPYFLYDLCPQGFLGQQIAKEMAYRSDMFPGDPRYWNASHIGRYLISNGDDLPGNLKLGEQALWRVRRKIVTNLDSDYPELADNVMDGIIPGSSAGGERPKFTTYSQDQKAHVIVKFSPRGKSEVARRWRDILITEFHALEAIQQKNILVADTRLIELGGRLFLESRRFDRAGEYGRMSMFSVQCVDAEFVGLGTGWPQVFDRLLQRDLISQSHLYDVEMLWMFGRLINNTDMHLGNLSVAVDGDIFRLLPVYDMCSMGFAPKSGGEASPYNFVPPKIQGISLAKESLEIVNSMARDFWKSVKADERISSEFRDYLMSNNPADLIR